MAIEKFKLVQVFFQTLRMGTARMKEDKETEKEGKQKGMKIKSTVCKKELSLYTPPRGGVYKLVF